MNDKTTVPDEKIIELRDRQPTSSLLDIAAVAERLGVSIRHVRRLVDEKRIPYIKWGHLLRFDPDEVEAWIDDCRRRPLRPA